MEISLSPDGRLLALTPLSAIQRVDLFDPKTGRRLYSLREDAGAVWRHAWSGNSQRLAVARSNGDVQVWNVPEIERLLAEAGFGP
jgi:WD40 repeat protein